jgi:hypothetical protein
MKIRLLAGFLLALALGACDTATGGEEEACASASLLGPYTCDDGLVCNEARATPTCERRNINALGAACTSDQNCVVGLWCEHRACAKPLGEGDACPGGVGCGPGLQCVKEGPAPITCQKAP